MTTWNANFGRTSRSTIQSTAPTSRDHCMMWIKRCGISTALAQFSTRSRMRLAFALRAWTLRTCTLGCGSRCFRGTRRTWTCTVSTTFITEHRSRGMLCHQSTVVGSSAWLQVGSTADCLIVHQVVIIILEVNVSCKLIKCSLRCSWKAVASGGDLCNQDILDRETRCVIQPYLEIGWFNKKKIKNWQYWFIYSASWKPWDSVYCLEEVSQQVWE